MGAAIINVPASILSNIGVYETPSNLFTPVMHILPLPAP